MTYFDVVDDLADELNRLVPVAGGPPIGIDGWDKAGKTTLAREVADRIKGVAISLDAYIDAGCSGYVPCLRLERIRSRLERAGRPALLEGVCLLAAAERIGTKLGRLIYVKHIDRWGAWLDEKECDVKDPEDRIRKLEDELALVGGSGTRLSEWRKEMIRYHARYRPHERADYVFNRREP